MKKFSFVLLALLLFSFSVSAQTEVEKIVERARKLSGEDKSAEAIAEIGKALALEPNQADLYITRANFYFDAENKPEILKDAQKAASLAPTDRQILYHAALILHRSRQYQEALKISDQLMALGNVDRFGWLLRVQIKTHLEDFFGAFEDASAGSDLFPDDDYLKQNQANLIRLLGNSEGALELYDRIIAAAEKKLAKATDVNEKLSIKRSLSMFLFSRGGIHFTKLNREQALADLARAVEHQPEASSYFMRAKIYRQQKMFPEAIADLTSALENRKQFDKVQLLVERGDLYVFTEKYDEALKDYEAALKEDEKIRPLYDARIQWVNKMRGKSPNQPK